MALVVSAGAAILGIVRGDAWLAVGAASLGGACLGFLPRNLSFPARIFLGDGGSMPMGFAAAVLVMVAASTSAVAWRSLLVALLLVGIPGARHEPRDRLPQASRRVDPQRRAGPSHPSRSQVPAEHPRGRVDAGSRCRRSCRCVAILASEGGASFIVIGAILYLLAAAVAIMILETQQRRGVRRSGRGGRSGVGWHASPRPDLTGRRVPAGPLTSRACVPDRARPRRRAEPVLLRLLRHLGMGAARPGARARMRDGRRGAPHAPRWPRRAGPRRSARPGRLVSRFHRLGGIGGERCGERQPLARLRRAAAAHAGARCAASDARRCCSGLPGWGWWRSRSRCSRACSATTRERSSWAVA